MRKNRTGYVCMLLAVAGLLFQFGRPFLLGTLILMLVLPLLLAVLLKTDAGKLQVKLSVRSGGKAGKELPAEWRISSKSRLFATGRLLIEMKVCNRMFGTEERKRILLESVESENCYPLRMRMPLCGEITIQCERIRIYDLLGLFYAEIAPFREMRTTIYPEQVSVELELENQREGAFSEDGIMQNRKGNDPSEMYDIREYVPGDDVRTIHWKLSSKTEGLILRQPSAAMHYQIALMPDLHGDQTITDAEWNRAVAVLTAAGEYLLRSGVPFCMLVPENASLAVSEIRSRRGFREALSRWMGSPVQRKEAEGFRYFRMDHMEQYFTRLLIVTAGKGYPDLKTETEQIRVVCMIATRECDSLQIRRWKNNTLAEIPVEEEKKGTWRVVC